MCDSVQARSPQLRLSLAVVACVLLLAACDRSKPSDNAATTAAAAGSAATSSATSAPTLSLGAEDILVLGAQSEAGAGLVISGSTQAERRADLRAEVSAVVQRVLKDNGEPVRRGELLVKLDDTAIRDSLASAEEADRAAVRSFEGAERQYQRLKSLQAQGMSSVQSLEEAEVRRNNAQSEAVAAKARVVSARQQLERTEVRAPFDGVVSARKTSPGDTAAMGKELIQVIDPGSMRFEGLVASERVAELKVGQLVKFKVHGQASGEMEGRIRRIDAVAQPITRQVSVIVEFTQGQRPRIAGLFAEGFVETGVSAPLSLPESTLVRQGQELRVWVLRDGALQLQTVTLGPRDARTGLYPLESGLQAGTKVLRNPASNWVAGQRAQER